MYASLTFNSANYESGLAKAEAQAKRADSSITASLKDAGHGAESAAATIGSAMAGGMKTVTSSTVGAVRSVASGVKSIASTAASATERIISGSLSAVERLGSAVVSVGRVASSVATVGLSVATAATTKLGQAAFSAYGEYEQLAGGIDTIFGASGTATQALKAYADNAFQTVQMSANEYMQNVTDFSASLLQTLDADAAADKADQALRQIADNSNKMGTAMASVEYAYKGFAKDNYTMLDNLKLGYGGTQGEMARLINDSGVLNGEMEATAENVKEIPFATIIDAIGVIQERLGMAGTSQEEALHTLQGTINMTRAAWQNLLTGFGNPDADMDKLLGDLMTSLDAVQENVIPAIERILNSMGGAITKAAPKLAERLSSLIENTAPALMTSAATLMSTFGGVILNTAPALIDSAVAAIADLIEGVDGSELVTAALNAAQSLANTLRDRLPGIVGTILGGISANSSQVADGVVSIVETLFETASATIDNIDVSEIITATISAAERIAATAQRYLPDILGKILKGANANAPKIRSGIVNVVRTLFDTFETVLKENDITELVGQVVAAIDDIIGIVALHAPTFIDAMASMWSTILSTALVRIEGQPMEYVNMFLGIIQAIIGGLSTIYEEVAPWLGAALTSLFESGFGSADPVAVATSIGTLIGNAIQTATELIDPEAIANTCVSLLNLLTAGLAPAIEQGLPAIASFIAQLTTAFTSEDNIETLKTAGGRILDAISSGIGQMAENGDLATIRSNVVTAVTSFAEWVTDPKQLEKMQTAGHDLLKGLSDGLDDDVEDIIAAAGKCIDNIITHLTSKYNLSKILDAIIDILTMISIGIINGLSDVVVGAGVKIWGWIADLIGDEDLKKRVAEIDVGEENPFKIKTDWYVGKTFETFRGMERDANLLTNDEYDEIMGNNIKTAESYRYDWSSNKYFDRDTGQVVDYKVIVQVDDRILGETDDVYRNRQRDTYGY